MKNKKKIFIIAIGVIFIGAVIYLASVHQKVEDTTKLTPEEFQKKYIKD
jgi:hypothetical protein